MKTKASDFIKVHGLNEAKDILKISENVGSYFDKGKNLLIHQSIYPPKTNGFDFVFKRSDLNSLVNSHELVEKVGGLRECREIVGMGSGYCVFDNVEFHTSDLEKAIIDVESCQ